MFRITSRYRVISGALAMMVVPVVLVSMADPTASATPTVAAHAITAHAAASAGILPTAAVDTGASPAHPFSNPIWYPLRAPAMVSCVHGNPGCRSPLYHPNWAMDLNALRDEPSRPVYAAGAGILHIGSQSSSCTAKGQATLGKWVWIDHGAGVASKYLHLDTITATDGEYVTPRTQIGTVGHTGTACGTQVNYLDFIVFHYGLSGTQVEVTSLRGCTGYGAQVWPRALNSRFRVWNSVPYKGLTMPASTNNCLPHNAPSTPATPSRLTLRRTGSGKLTASWPAAPAGDRVSREMLEIDVHHNNGNFGSRIYQPVSTARTSTVVSGLANGRTYRIRVSYYNSNGWSAPSSWRTGIPAALPSAPAVRSVTPTASSVHYLWRKSDGHGETVSGYEIGIHRQLANGSYTAWIYRRVSPAMFHNDFTGLRRHARYAVEVCAITSVGRSAWTRRYTSTLR
jgi:hypothetical protein